MSEQTIRSLAVDVADWMATASPAEMAAMRQHVEATKPGLVDQMDAASRDALSVIGSTVPEIDGQGTIPQGNVPEWLRLAIAETHLLYANGQARTCMHADPKHPQPLFAAAWRAGVVSCMQCTHLFGGLSAEDEMRCDQCGRVDPLSRPCRVTSGLLIYAWGACPDCHTAWTEFAQMTA